MTKRSMIDTSYDDGCVGHANGSRFLSGATLVPPTLEESGTRKRGEEEKGSTARHEAKLRCASPIGSHSQRALLDTLKDETENHLRAPLTPLSSGIVGEDGFPLNVQVAKSAYGQGRLSTGAFYRDCLPPALSICKSPSLPSTSTSFQDPSNGVSDSSGNCLSPPHGRKPTEDDGPGPVVKRRNLSHEAQLKRIDQAPLSAIYEEPAASQHACTCGLCSTSEGGRGIVWFHLCPRYAALAREKGIIYEPCEGRIIMHHGPDRSSVGLIIEGPMEDRFVPVNTPHEVAPAAKVKSSKPGRLDLRSMHSATNRAVRSLPRTTSGPKLHQLPPISTPALQRPISPATQVLHPTTLIPLSSTTFPEEDKTEFARKVAHISKGVAERSPNIAFTEPQEDVHPALRTDFVLPDEWTRPPSRSVSATSSREDLHESPRTPPLENPRSSSNYSDLSGDRPARKDSLGALKHLGSPEKHDQTRIEKDSHDGEPTTNVHARQLTSSTASSSLLSPFAGHERTPSVFLGPSTPSTASFQRSSVSSYGESLPSYMYPTKEEANAAEAKGARLASPFRSSQYLSKYDPDENHFSPQLSYRTAPNNHYAPSPSAPTPQTGYTSVSSLDQLRSKNANQNSPFFESQGYRRYQASEHSIAQTLDSLQLQREDTITSTTNLLNGKAFDDDTESKTQGGGHKREVKDADYDKLYTIDTHDTRRKSLRNPPRYRQCDQSPRHQTRDAERKTQPRTTHPRHRPGNLPFPHDPPTPPP